MKFSALSFVFLPALISCGGAGAYTSSSPAAPSEMISLDADWLDGDTTITPARLERVMAIGRKDREVAPILDEARARLGHGSMGELYALFSPCSADVPHENAGRTTARHDVMFIAPGLASIVAGTLDGDAAKQLADAKSSRDALRVEVEARPDYLTVRRWLIPKICISTHVPLATAYDALVHELVHALRRDPFAANVPDAATVPNRDALLFPYVLVAGDEVDAYIAGAGARVRLEKTTQKLLPALRGAFDQQGHAAISREAIAPLVLDAPPRGVGYRDGSLADALQRTLTDELTVDRAKRGVLVQVSASRREEGDALSTNAEIIRRNMSVRQKNIDIAKQNRDPASEKKFRDELASDQRELPKTETLAKAAAASLARLTTDLADLDRRIAAVEGALSRAR